MRLRLQMLGCMLPKSFKEYFSEGSRVRFSVVITDMHLKARGKCHLTQCSAGMAWNEVSRDSTPHIVKCCITNNLELKAVSSGKLCRDSSTSQVVLCNSYHMTGGILCLFVPLLVILRLISGFSLSASSLPFKAPQQPFFLWFCHRLIIFPQISYFMKSCQMVIF